MSDIGIKLDAGTTEPEAQCRCGHFEDNHWRTGDIGEPVISGCSICKCRAFSGISESIGMSHEALCERARRWLSGGRRCEPVFSNIGSCSEIPDAIGWSSRWAWHGSTVVECKTSRGDFYGDGKKYVTFEHIDGGYRRPWIGPNHPEFSSFRRVELPRMGDFRFFMSERGIVTPEMVAEKYPDHGLIEVIGKRRIIVSRQAKRRESQMVDKDGEIRYLRFAIINKKAPYDRANLRQDAPTLSVK